MGFLNYCGGSLTLTVTAASWAITGNLNYLSAVITPGTSNVGPESGLTLALFDDLINFVIADVLVPEANLQLNAGIPLPTIPGITFQNSVLTMENGFVLIGLDFQIA
jgi:hypothetical protein